MKNLKLNKKYPWLNQYKDVPANLEYFEGSMVSLLGETAIKYPNYYALEYYNNKITYKEFMKKIDSCARSLKAIGVEEGDVVSICMPNTPTALVMFYAINMIGAISNMIHPLSSEKEIELYLNKSSSSVILTIDFNYKKVLNLINNTKVSKVIVSSAGYDLKGLKKFFYLGRNTDVTKGVKKIGEVFLKAFRNREVLSYKKFLQRGENYYEEHYVDKTGDDPAVILYSGGTSGMPKGIVLTNKNFNALAQGAHLMCDPAKAKDSILSIMPIFHGFGLGVCIHTPLYIGMKCILVPKFKANKLLNLIRKTKPNFFVGVPTLFEALYMSKNIKENDFESINVLVSGGDVMSEEKIKKYNDFFKKYGSNAKIRVGYGLTEATAATCLVPNSNYKENSIGIPFPDTIYKIVKIGTTKEVDYLEDGEICLSGPTVMKCYLDEESETNNTLKIHKDGKLWLHTGDIGTMDKDGFIYFKSRLKRLIISSGYNVYPSYIEEIINKHEYVSSCTVVPVPHKYRGEVVKAYIVLKKEVKINEEVEEEIKKHCQKYIAKYAMPKIFEFRKELPKTLVGKIAYTILEDESKISIEEELKEKPKKEKKEKKNKHKKTQNKNKKGKQK